MASRADDERAMLIVRSYTECTTAVSLRASFSMYEDIPHASVIMDRL
ncbi:MAG: hypothetical protein J5961_05640 [Mogibacterium sp.]|nr:hypothetical protein [Mogibacterium sp.]